MLDKPVTNPPGKNTDHNKVLILGGGFGGTYTLGYLTKLLKRKENVEITLVNNENYFLFSPMLHEVATGVIETRHIAYPIRRLKNADMFHFIQADVENINLTERKVVTTAGELDYNYLVLALGCVPDISKLRLESGDVFTLKSLYDARKIKNHVIGLFERAAVEKSPDIQSQLLNFVVSGGGYIGVQVVMALQNFIFHDLTRLYKVIDPQRIGITLVEKESEVLPQLPNNISAYVKKRLNIAGINIRLDSRVTHAGKDYIEINDNETIPTNTLIWVSGVMSGSAVTTMDVEKDNIGRILVNEYLEVPDFPGVYAVGDGQPGVRVEAFRVGNGNPGPDEGAVPEPHDIQVRDVFYRLAAVKVDAQSLHFGLGPV